MQSIEVQMLPRNASANIVDMEHITDIVNRVYAASEGSFWMQGAIRTTVVEMSAFTGGGEIAVARLMGEIVGCVRIGRIDQETGEFGMLAVDYKYQGTGIGRSLIRFAERKCQKEQLRKMQIELLVPQEGSHPDKEILKSWYTRIGYHPIHTKTVDDLFPKLAQRLATPCKFVVFQKELG